MILLKPVLIPFIAALRVNSKQFGSVRLRIRLRNSLLVRGGEKALTADRIFDVACGRSAGQAFIWWNFLAPVLN